ncbi:MAG: hypothetical protein JW829_07765 [Pirellulales bacterium]|nr:hypothetical protein [Pirellulales bacterium]
MLPKAAAETEGSNDLCTTNETGRVRKSPAIPEFNLEMGILSLRNLHAKPVRATEEESEVIYGGT